MCADDHWGIMTAIDLDTDEVVDEPAPAVGAKLKHPRAIRWMHWINFPLLLIMIWTGYRIYWADLRDPFVLGVGDYSFFEFWPTWVNENLELKSRLARGMAFHFSFGWLFTLNGIAYGLYTWRSGEWRQIVPERGSLRDSVQVFLHDLGIGRKKPLPPQARYNGAQRLTYSLILVLGGIEVLTGLAIYKPTQLSMLTSLFGGYETARLIHFAITIVFLVFFVVHLLQVGRAGWANFMSMVTGYEKQARAQQQEANSND
jgi:thiosulfate reductase cytochrome b subunit